MFWATSPQAFQLFEAARHRRSAKTISSLAELGVVFLLFLIGLELSFERLITMRRLVFGLGGLQVW